MLRGLLEDVPVGGIGMSLAKSKPSSERKLMDSREQFRCPAFDPIATMYDNPWKHLANRSGGENKTTESRTEFEK